MSAKLSMSSPALVIVHFPGNRRPHGCAEASCGGFSLHSMYSLALLLLGEIPVEVIAHL